MLEQFKVPQKDRVLVGESALRQCLTVIFDKLGVSPDDALGASDVFVMSDLGD